MTVIELMLMDAVRQATADVQDTASSVRRAQPCIDMEEVDGVWQKK